MNAHSRKTLRALIEGGVMIHYDEGSDRLMLAGNIEAAKRLHPRVVKHRAQLIPVVVKADTLAQQLLSRIMANAGTCDTPPAARNRQHARHSGR